MYRTYMRHVSLTYHTNRAPYHRFRQCYDGVKPRGVKKFKEVAEICSALVIVQTAVTPGSCMPDARQTPLISSAHARADARSAYVLTSCSSPTMR